jgi:hypothetical protein
MRTSVVLLFVFLSSVPIYTYAQLAPPILLRLDILPLSGSAEPRLESILRGTIELALAQGPFRVYDSSDPGARENQPDLELKLLYTLSDGRVALRLSFRDQGAFLPPQDEARELELDPQFDQAVTALVVSLLSESAAIVAALPAPPSTAPMPALLVPATAVQESPSSAAEDAVIGNGPEPQSMPQAHAMPAVPDPKPPSSFDTGVGVFMPLGEASIYFNAAPRLHVLYGRYLNEGRNWRLSIAGSFMGFLVSGESQERAFNYFTLLGSELGYGFRPSAGFDPWLAAGLGSALVVVNAEDKIPLVKVLPYLSISLGSNFKLSRSLSFGPGLAWSLFLDYGRGSSYLLMGLNPSLAARLEL